MDKTEQICWKQKARDYMEDRQKRRTPPPSMHEIRRQLGWDLIEMSRKVRRD
jgi:hypothetical protein